MVASVASRSGDRMAKISLRDSIEPSVRCTMVPKDAVVREGWDAELGRR